MKILKDDVLLAELTDDERQLATADNAPLWRELAVLRILANEVVGGWCSRLDRHGFDRAVNTNALRSIAAMLPKKPVVTGDRPDAHNDYERRFGW